MYCKNCGKEIDDGVKFCPECGTKLFSDDSIENKIDKLESKGPEKQLNTMCLAGVIVSGVSLFLNFYGTVGLAGLIISYMGYKAVKTSGEKGRELSIIGMVIGGITVVLGIISLIYLFYLYSLGISVLSGFGAFINGL